MEKKTKIIIGVSIGVVALIALVYYLIKRKQEKELELSLASSDTTSSSSSSSESSNSSSTSSKYSKEDIGRMQERLLEIADQMNNSKITNAITSTGGIDGIAGPGFMEAMNEAIRIGAIYSMEDLYYQSIF